MIRKINLFLFIFVLVVSCNLAEAKTTKKVSPEPASKAMPTANCWCRMNMGQPDWTGNDWDLGSVSSYGGISPQTKQANKTHCRQTCSNAINNWFQQNKDNVCKMFGGVGTAIVIGQSKLGTNEPDVVSNLSTKCCEKPEVYKCPQGSIPDGGGRCKKELGTCKINPAPPNGTQIGNPADPWGFWWNGGVVQWLKAISYQPKTFYSCG